MRCLVGLMVCMVTAGAWAVDWDAYQATVDIDGLDTEIIFILNPQRSYLEPTNTLRLTGSNVAQLVVEMNSGQAPTVMNGNGYMDYTLSSPDPDNDFIRVTNTATGTVTFSMNLNDRMFLTNGAVVREAQSSYSGTAERRVWRFICENMYHHDPLTPWHWINSSPALFFNSLGWGYCDDAAMLFCQMMTMLGYETRLWRLAGHVVSEVWADGRWQMYDADLEVYYLDDTGFIMGVEDLAAHPEFIMNPISPVLERSSAAYSQAVADMYSSTGNNEVVEWELDESVPSYALRIQLPPGSTFEFPSIFGGPVPTVNAGLNTTYTNARLTIHGDYTGRISVPFIVYSVESHEPPAPVMEPVEPEPVVQDDPVIDPAEPENDEQPRDRDDTGTCFISSCQ